MKILEEYCIGDTPLYKANNYCSCGSIYLKLEMFNFLGSIKSRTAYYIIKDLFDKDRLHSNTTVVESTSGNLGIALSFFTKEFKTNFLCLIDPFINNNKLKQLEELGTNIYEVQRSGDLDYRSSRIKLAQELNSKENYIWVNQYSNPANVLAHYETTGKEIWSQSKGNIDYLVSTVGSGGTISGTALFLKEKNKSIKIIAVEPFGSCIFGGEPANYYSAGAGLAEPSDIIKKYFYLIDEFHKVKDSDAQAECLLFKKREGFSVGHTTGMCLFIARELALKYNKANIVVISPDDEYEFINK